MEFKDRIKKARKDAGLTQDGLAEALGVERLAVQRWESGQRQPKANSLAGWEKATGTSLRWLITGQQDSIRTKVKEIRRRMGVSQERLAELMEVSETTIRHWESGRRVPSRSNIGQLAILGKVPVGWFFGEVAP